MVLRKESLENIAGKGENGDKKYYLFPKSVSPFSHTYHIFFFRQIQNNGFDFPGQTKPPPPQQHSFAAESDKNQQTHLHNHGSLNILLFVNPFPNDKI